MAKETLLQSMWIGYGEDKILRIKILEGVTIDLKQAKLMNESMQRLAEEATFPVLIDARVNYDWDKDAQEYVALNSGFRLATAVITNNPLVRVLSNSYSKIFKPSYPLRIFSDEEKAIAWLKEMMENR
jgi:hypothetical protein